MLCIEKACFKDIVLRPRIWMVEINTLLDSTSRQCIHMVVYQLPMLQIFSLEQVGNSSSISLSYNWAHSENPIAIILLSSSRWISRCYVLTFLAIGFLGTFTHFLRSGFAGSAGMALFCVSSKVWFILPNPIWCHRGKPPSAPSNFNSLKQIGAH
jgi:hypothetical protein